MVPQGEIMDINKIIIQNIKPNQFKNMKHP